MMKAIFVYCMLTLTCIACRDTKNALVVKEEPFVKQIIYERRKPASGFTDTLTINSPAAVFFAPDSLQWKKLKQMTDTMVYASFEHDCFYQMRNAQKVLKQYYPGIKIIEAANVRYLLFLMTNGSTACTDLDSVSDPCGIFLFTSQKKPHPADMMNIETELGFYFKG
jgi:hypothetical protein